MRAIGAGLYLFLVLQLVIPVSAWAQDNSGSDDSCLIERPSQYLEPRSANQLQLGTRAEKTEEEEQLRIPRPAQRAVESAVQSGEASPDLLDNLPVVTAFTRWQRHFGNPVICNMIFCHTSCADYNDSCPSFFTAIIQLSKPSGCGDDHMVRQADNSHTLETPVTLNERKELQNSNKNCCQNTAKSETFPALESLSN